MQPVPVVGGAGYMGGATVDVLNESGYQVRVYDNLLYEGEYREQVDFAYGDIRDQARIRPHLDWADVVVWLAAIAGDGACAFNPKMAMVINRDSVAWLSNNFDGRIIFMSTCSVFGAQDGPLRENSPTDPLSIYAASKLEAEQFPMEPSALILPAWDRLRCRRPLLSRTTRPGRQYAERQSISLGLNGALGYDVLTCQGNIFCPPDTLNIQS